MLGTSTFVPLMFCTLNDTGGDKIVIAEAAVRVSVTPPNVTNSGFPCVVQFNAVH